MYAVDTFCFENDKATLSDVNILLPPHIGMRLPIYEQTAFDDGDTVNDDGEEAPFVLIGVFLVEGIDVSLCRFGPDFGNGDRAYTRGRPLLRLSQCE